MNSLITQVLSLPDAYGVAHTSLRDVLRFELSSEIGARLPDGRLSFATRFVSTTRFGVDFGSVELNEIAVLKDAELVIKAVKSHPGKLASVVAQMQSSDPAQFRSAGETLKMIGLTEEAAVQAGGGLIFLVIAALVAAGYAGCGHCGGMPAPKPAPDP